MAERPQRIRVLDEAGRSVTLDEGPGAFERLGLGPQVLFLGLGPRPELLARWFPEARAGALYVERPGFEPGPGAAGFRRVLPRDLDRDALAGSTTYFFRQNARLLPSFWGPVWARCRALALGLERSDPGGVWLPGTGTDLLGRDLALGFEAAGLTALRIDQGLSPEGLAGLMAERGAPGLFFSVNFRGLDPYGRAFHLLREAGSRVAAWCVDNPFHLLSGIRSGFWRDLDLFVTDDWFLGPLAGLGARRVFHLPLAAGAAFAGPDVRAGPADLEGRLVFVGRSRFPGKEAFFAGCSLPPQAFAQARDLLLAGSRPDFGWWAQRLGLRSEALWPGDQARRAGFCAEETGRLWRGMCLRAAGPGLVVFGDPGWLEDLGPAADLRPPVDYERDLPGVYRAASLCLNMTSPLLPSGLTQRHFDVWAAGGFLITDQTPGLGLFPADLVREVVFRTPADIPNLARALLRDPARRLEIGAAWRALVLRGHTYAHRAARVLSAAGPQR